MTDEDIRHGTVSHGDTPLNNVITEDDVTPEELVHAEVLWNYMKLNYGCMKSDVILCMCSYDIRVAERAASLWLQGMADTIVFSGNTGKLTKDLWSKSEAEVFKQRALEMGVPDSNILTEVESRNSGENVRFTYKLLRKKNISPTSFILVQKPYMERRAYATFMKQWPGNADDLSVCVTSPDIRLLDYPTNETGSLCDVITVLVGDMARIPLYEDLGFQIHQDVPEEVQTSFLFLKNTGKYNGHLPSCFGCSG